MAGRPYYPYMDAETWRGFYVSSAHSRDMTNWVELTAEDLKAMHPVPAEFRPVIKLVHQDGAGTVHATFLRACKTFFTFDHVRKKTRSTPGLFHVPYKQCDAGEMRMYALRLPSNTQ